MRSLVQDLLATATEVLHGERGLVLKPTPATQDMSVVAAVGLDPETAWNSGQISQTILRQVATDKAPLLTHCAFQDPRFEDTTSVVLSGLRSIIIAPILVEGQLWGLFYIDSLTRSGIFHDSDLVELGKFAEHVASLVQESQKSA